MQTLLHKLYKLHNSRKIGALKIGEPKTHWISCAKDLNNKCWVLIFEDTVPQQYLLHYIIRSFFKWYIVIPHSITFPKMDNGTNSYNLQDPPRFGRWKHWFQHVSTVDVPSFTRRTKFWAWNSWSASCRCWMGCWGLLGLIVRQWIILRSFPIVP